MCERYVLPDQAAAEREFMPAQTWWKFAPRFNVAATQFVPAVRIHEGASEGVMMRWGLIPAWTKGRPADETEACATVEQVERSVLYRAAWLNSQRCILPLAGFYTWQLTESRYRQPHFVRLAERSVFGVAAVWDRWVSEDDDVIESCAVVCVPANELLAPMMPASPRMPAILRRRDYATWLSGTPVQAKAVLQPYKANWMHAYAISPRINSVVADDSGLIAPVH